jgi:hypothetical protein
MHILFHYTLHNLSRWTVVVKYPKNQSNKQETLIERNGLQCEFSEYYKKIARNVYVHHTWAIWLFEVLFQQKQQKT